MSTKTLYADLDRVLPEALTNVRQSNKRIKVDLTPELKE